MWVCCYYALQWVNRSCTPVISRHGAVTPCHHPRRYTSCIQPQQQPHDRQYTGRQSVVLTWNRWGWTEQMDWQTFAGSVFHCQQQPSWHQTDSAAVERADHTDQVSESTDHTQAHWPLLAVSWTCHCLHAYFYYFTSHHMYNLYIKEGLLLC